MSETKITYVSGLALENGKLKTVEHEGKEHSDGAVMESWLIPTDTEPAAICEFLQVWVKSRYEIVEAAKRTILINS